MSNSVDCFRAEITEVLTIFHIIYSEQTVLTSPFCAIKIPGSGDNTFLHKEKKGPLFSSNVSSLSLLGTSQNESRHTVYKAKFVKPRISKFTFLASVM